MRSEIKFLYQGIPGCFSYQAIDEFILRNENVFNKFKIIKKQENDFESLFSKLDKNSLAMVPIENSTTGIIRKNYDLIATKEIEIIAEFVLKIEHSLISYKNNTIKDIKVVVSHPEALRQCYNFIKKNNLKAKKVFDTAGAVKILKDNLDNPEYKYYGAIASKIAANVYGLKVIKEKIQDSQNNYTRFLIIKNKKSKLNLGFSKNKVSVVFETKDIPAALYKCLGGFATNNINLTKIESRPKSNNNHNNIKNQINNIKKHNNSKIFDYVFYLDFEGDLKSQNVKNALKELKFFSNNLKILGNYMKFE